MEILIAVFSGLAVFLIILLIATIFSSDNVKLIKTEKKSVESICNKYFNDTPEIVAQKMGIAIDKYLFNCNILGVKPKVEQIIVARIIAFIIFVIGGALALLISNIVVKVLIIIFTAAVSAIVFVAPTATINSRAADKQAQFQSEIPRFLDLLQTALKINLPIATAIKITAESVNGLLSEELLKALTISEIGTSNWQDALYDVATKYEVDDFSDFVLDIVTSYQKGADITDSIERQSKDLKTTALLRAKENASKVTSLILLPVVIFKMIPLMIILFMPVVMQLFIAF